MNKKTDTRAQESAEELREHAQDDESTAREVTRVYCGPSVRGVARQYTVYAGKIPEALELFMKLHPEARGLLVSAGEFARVRSNLGRSGTAEAILYQKIKSEL